MARNQELKVTAYVIRESDGLNEPALWDSLSPEEQKRCSQKLGESLAQIMSENYSRHPERFAALS